MTLVVPVSEMWCPHCEVAWGTKRGTLLFCWVCSRPGATENGLWKIVNGPHHAVARAQGPVVQLGPL